MTLKILTDYFSFPTVEASNPSKDKISKCAVAKTASAVASLFLIVKSAYNNVYTLGLAYGCYEAATVAKNLQQIYLNHESKDKDSGTLFQEMTQNAPATRRLAPFIMSSDSLKGRLFPPA